MDFEPTRPTIYDEFEPDRTYLREWPDGSFDLALMDERARGDWWFEEETAYGPLTEEEWARAVHLLAVIQCIHARMERLRQEGARALDELGAICQEIA